MRNLKFMIYYTFQLLLYYMLQRIEKQVHKIWGTMKKIIKQKILIVEWTTIHLAIHVKKVKESICYAYPYAKSNKQTRNKKTD